MNTEACEADSFPVATGLARFRHVMQSWRYPILVASISCSACDVGHDSISSLDNAAGGRSEMPVVSVAESLRASPMSQSELQSQNANEAVSANVIQFSTWASLGGNTDTTWIGVGSNYDGRLEIFAEMAADHTLGHLWQVQQNGDWGGWSSLGGTPRGSLRVARNSDGRLEVFANAPDLSHIWQARAGGAWSGWEVFTSTVVGAFALAANADGRLEVFQLRDYAILHSWQNSARNAWSAMERLPPLPSGPKGQGLDAVQGGDGRLYVATSDASGHVWLISQNSPNSSWGGWADLGAPNGSQFTVGSPLLAIDANGIVVVVAAAAGSVWIGQQWQGWTNLGRPGGGADGRLAVARNRSGALEIFSSAGGSLWRLVQNAATTAEWSGWISMGSPLNSGLASYVAIGTNADGRLELFVEGSDHNMWHAWQLL